MSSAVVDASRRSLSIPDSWRKGMQIAGWVFTVAAVLGWIFFLRPQNLGGPAAYVMVSGESMEPTYETGDFVVARLLDSYDVGDVMVYRVPEGNAGAGRLIIHRVIGGNMEDGFITQGDNRETPDQWRPKEEDVVGKLWFHVPNAASAFPYLRSPIVLAGFFGGLTFLYVVFGKGDEDEKKAETSTHKDVSAPPPPPPVLRESAVEESLHPVALATSDPAATVEWSVETPRARRAVSPSVVGAGLVAALVAYLLYRRRRS